MKKVENPKAVRSYSFACITYMEHENLLKMLREQARNWATILHDKDTWTEDDEKKNPEHIAGTPKEAHRHFVATFDREHSVMQIERLCKTYGAGQNTLVQPITKDFIGDRIEYLWHANDNGKYQYDRNLVEYSSKTFIEKYVKGEVEENTDNFLDDLLAPASEFSIVRMGRVYGRDFMKNFKSYLSFRTYALAEQQGVYVPEQLARDEHVHGDIDYIAERDAIRAQNENINNFLKGKL